MEGGDDDALRPLDFKGFIGQDQIVDNLQTMIASAHAREEPIDHLLFAGPPGLGKTTLAGIVASQMEARLRVTTAPVLRNPKTLGDWLLKTQLGDVMFIDEIHRLRTQVEENLYPAMEDFVVDMAVQGQTIRVTLPEFTLVGATTLAGDLNAPLLDRFGYIARLDYYTVLDLARIVARTAQILGVEMTPPGRLSLAGRSRGTPRVANRLVRRIRDYHLGSGRAVDTSMVNEAAWAFGIDAAGLDIVDRKILRYLADSGPERPVGLDTLAAAVSEAPVTIAAAHEPYLLRQGYILRSARGRIITRKGQAHLAQNGSS